MAFGDQLVGVNLVQIKPDPRMMMLRTKNYDMRIVDWEINRPNTRANESGGQQRGGEIYFTHWKPLKFGKWVGNTYILKNKPRTSVLAV